MMNELITKQAVLDIVDDLRDQMTVEGYCAMVERVKALPSVQPVDKDIDVPVKDCISRQMLLEYIHGEPVGKLLCDKYNLDGLIEQFPSAQPETHEKRTEMHACDYERAVEQLEHDMLYEPTFNQDDGSM